MKSTHQIRLHGPWQAKVVESISHQKLAGTTLKAQLGGLSEGVALAFHGKVNLHRNFNRPTGLEDDSTVTLCIEGFGDHATFFNQVQISATAGSEGGLKQYRVGDRLLAFNRIELKLLCPSALIRTLPSPKIGVSPAIGVTQDQEMLVAAGRVWLEIC